MNMSRSPGFGLIARITLVAVAVAVVGDNPAAAQPQRPRRSPKSAVRKPVVSEFGSVNGKAKTAQPASKTNKVKTNTGSGKSPLAGFFAGNDGGAYFVSEYKQGGKHMVAWFAEHPGRGYAHVYRGTRTGHTIDGKYWSIPKAKATTSGSLKLKVNGNGSMTRLSSTGGFPTNSWTVRSIQSVVSQLPGKQNPGFTRNTFGDLDGAFDDAQGYRYYIRQTGNEIFGVAEAPFKKGQRPAAVMVIIAQRNNAAISGRVVAVPKGLKSGSSTITFSVKSNRSMTKSSSLPFGGGPLLPVLPDIKVPISQAMNIVNSQMNKVEILLNGYKNGPLANGSYVKFGNGKPAKFSLPYVTVKITKLGRQRQTFIHDIKSDIINVKTIGRNLSRLSIIFEEGGKELKRRMIGAVGDDDKRLADWDIKDIRVDVEFSLVNYGKSISYEIKTVKLHAVVDIRALPEKLDEWVTKKIRPEVEKAIKNELNKSAHRTKVSDAVAAKLKSLQEFTSKYNLYGYSASSLVPKKVFISGNDIVFRFHD